MPIHLAPPWSPPSCWPPWPAACPPNLPPALTPSAPAPAGTASPKAVASDTSPAATPAATASVPAATVAPGDTQTPADTQAPAASPAPATRPAVDRHPAAPGHPRRHGSGGGIKLTSSGPWLVSRPPRGIWAVNADGNGLTSSMPAAPYFRLGPAAPQGGHVSVVTASDTQGYHDLTLWVLGLPGGSPQKVTALTHASTEPGADAPGDLLDVLTPLGEAAWSPDGQTLAFIGAQAGPSADLFTYSLATGQVTRLTDGASQAFGPSWSPDGKYAVAGRQHLWHRRRHGMDGVWAAAADNSGVTLLYKPRRAAATQYSRRSSPSWRILDSHHPATAQLHRRAVSDFHRPRRAQSDPSLGPFRHGTHSHARHIVRPDAVVVARLIEASSF